VGSTLSKSAISEIVLCGSLGICSRLLEKNLTSNFVTANWQSPASIAVELMRVLSIDHEFFAKGRGFSLFFRRVERP